MSVPNHVVCIDAFDVDGPVRFPEPHQALVTCCLPGDQVLAYAYTESLKKVWPGFRELSLNLPQLNGCRLAGLVVVCTMLPNFKRDPLVPLLKVKMPYMCLWQRFHLVPCSDLVHLHSYCQMNGLMATQ